MYIIIRSVCETFSRIAVTISFPWGHKHGVYAAASFSENVTLWCSRNCTKNLTSVILYKNIIFIAQWLSGGNSEILRGSDVFARCQKLCKKENSFKQTRVNFFFRENMTSFLNYVTATLRALFAWRGSNILESWAVSAWMPALAFFFEHKLASLSNSYNMARIIKSSQGILADCTTLPPDFLVVHNYPSLPFGLGPPPSDLHYWTAEILTTIHLCIYFYPAQSTHTAVHLNLEE